MAHFLCVVLLWELETAPDFVLMCCQAQRDAEREKELKLRHTAVQRSFPRPTEVTSSDSQSPLMEAH